MKKNWKGKFWENISKVRQEEGGKKKKIRTKDTKSKKSRVQNEESNKNGKRAKERKMVRICGDDGVKDKKK
jgi:hypothetical protein